MEREEQRKDCVGVEGIEDLYEVEGGTQNCREIEGERMGMGKRKRGRGMERERKRVSSLSVSLFLALFSSPTLVLFHTLFHFLSSFITFSLPYFSY